MKTSICVVCALLGLLPAFGAAGASCQYGSEPSPRTLDRQQAIEAELAAIGAHDWAGEYHAGSESYFYDIEVALAPTAGVVTFSTESDGIIFSQEDVVQPQPNGSLRMPMPRYCTPNTLLWPVRWGGRHYLIEDSELEAFVSAINLGDEPRRVARDTFLLRKGDHEKPVDGLPDLPLANRLHLRSEPLVLHPVATEAVKPTPNDSSLCERDFMVYFEAGTDQGLVVGTELQAVGHNRNTRAHLGAVSVREASGYVRVTAIRCEELVPPDASWEFTTGAYRP